VEGWRYSLSWVKWFIGYLRGLARIISPKSCTWIFNAAWRVGIIFTLHFHNTLKVREWYLKSICDIFIIHGILIKLNYFWSLSNNS
jgi:hypothetical protein